MTSVKDADQGVFFPSFYRVPGRASFPEFTRASSLKLVRPAATARALSRSRTACGGKYLTSCLTRVGGPEILVYVAAKLVRIATALLKYGETFSFEKAGISKAVLKQWELEKAKAA